MLVAGSCLCNRILMMKQNKEFKTVTIKLAPGRSSYGLASVPPGLAPGIVISFYSILHCDPGSSPQPGTNKGREDQVFCGYFICFQMRHAPSIHTCNLEMPSGPDKNNKLALYTRNVFKRILFIHS